MSVFSKIHRHIRSSKADTPPMDESKKDLCSICRDTLPTLSAGAIHGKIPIGSLKEIIDRRYCPFCDTILDVLNLSDPRIRATEQATLAQPCFIRRDDDARPNDIEVYLDNLKRGSIRIFRRTDKLSIFAREKPSPKSIQLLNNALLPGTTALSLTDTKRTDLRPGSVPNSSSVDSSHALIREYCTRVSIPLIRGWLRDCETSHRSVCSETLLQERQAFPASLLLVDVKSQCLVKETSLSRYIALSYVWGRVEMFQTTMSTLESLQRPGGVLLQSSTLPIVIQDAMAFVNAMGEAYLWVDTLCIVQDDADRKHWDIHQMDVIYSHALLTIVALSGADASSPLPGIRPGSRAEWKLKDAGIFRYLPTPRPLYQALAMSPLEQRAWTMQERMLSRRCVYFSDQQVYFQCLKSFQYEIPAAQLRDTSNLLSLMPNPLVSARQHQYDESWSWQVDGYRKFDIYRDLVGMYSRRKLSYVSDNLNAFSGIAKALRKCGYGRFLYGIPDRGLHIALLWLAGAPLKCSAASSQAVAPTWSWAAWQGPVTWPLTIPRETASHAVTPRCDITPVRMWRPDCYDDTDTQYLHIFAYTSKNFYFRFIRHSAALSIYTAEGLHCGKVLDGDHTFVSKRPAEELEYVLLSSLLLNDSTMSLVDGTRFSIEHYVVTPRCLVNVMLVQNFQDEKYNGNDKYAKRVAICQIHKDAWEASQSTQRCIRLV